MKPEESKSNAVRAKKSKLEKICELESTLKVLKEENRRLRKDLHMQQSGPGASSARVKEEENNDNVVNYKEMDVEKMKDALKALKSVTVNQERSLQTLRAKAHQRRKELKDKDTMIAVLQKQVLSLTKTQKAMEGSTSDDPSGGSEILRAKLVELQRSCLDEETKNIKLTEKLEETEAQVKKLLKQLKAATANSSAGGPSDLLRPYDQSRRSFRSTTDVSVSTTQEFDLSRMKKDLAGKSNAINELEMELEMVKEELHELKKKKGVPTSASLGKASSTDGFDSDPFSFPDFQSDGFGAFSHGDPFATFEEGDGSYSEEEEDDFW
jgi:hypothetical protein